MDESAPSVRVEVETASDNVPTQAPQLGTIRRRSPTVIAITVTAVAAIVLLAANWSSPSPEQVPSTGERSVAPASEEAVAMTELDPAQRDALDIAIDSFDRIAYTTGSPPLDAIHRSTDAWYSIDAGLLYRSNDLINWIVTSDLWELRALSLDSSSGEPLALLETGQQLFVQSVDQQERIAGTHLTGEAIMGAMRYPHWVVVEIDADGYWLTTGDASETIGRTQLAAPPMSLAINDGYVLLGFSDSVATRLLSLPTTSADPNEAEWCLTTVPQGSLTTSGDGTVHFVGGTIVWIVDGALLLSMVDSTLLDPGTRSTTAPLATGDGWSVTTGVGSDRPTVWTTRNGTTFDRIEVPRSKGEPVRVVWAYLEASEGLGVKVSDVAMTNGLLRVGDPRTRHPRPQDLDRSVDVLRTTWKRSLREPPIQCGLDLVSLSTG